MKADGVGPGGGRWGAVMAEPRRSQPGAGPGETPGLPLISPPVFPLALYSLPIQPVWVSLGAQKNAEEGGSGEGGLSLGNCDGREFTNRNETRRSGRASNRVFRAGSEHGELALGSPHGVTRSLWHGAPSSQFSLRAGVLT